MAKAPRRLSPVVGPRELGGSEGAPKREAQAQGVGGRGGDRVPDSKDPLLPTKRVSPQCTSLLSGFAMFAFSVFTNSSRPRPKSPQRRATVRAAPNARVAGPPD